VILRKQFVFQKFSGWILQRQPTGKYFMGPNEMPMNQTRWYRIFISILFGLLGFALNSLDVQIPLATFFKISILSGLLFPLLISSAWGWRYGLLSVLSGVCQSMWWLWRSDGYGLLYGVPVFVLWIVWHGYWAERRKQSPSSSVYHSRFWVEIPFRIVSELGFYTVFRWLVSLNPPPWNPAITWNAVPLNWLHVVALKHTLTGLLLLLISHVLLEIKMVCRFFGLSTDQSFQNEISIIYSWALLVGMGLWGADALIGYLIFNPFEQNFWEIAILNVAPRELFSRNMYFLVTLLAGMGIARIARGRMQLKNRLEHINEILLSIRNVNQLICQEKNQDRLLKRTCEMLTETRGFYNAWIAIRQDSGYGFYHSGFHGEFQSMARQIEAGRLPAGFYQALSRSGVQVVTHPFEECTDCLLATGSGYPERAALRVRIEYEDQILGVLVVSAPRMYADDPQEHDLLREVAGDLGFALSAEKQNKECHFLQSRYDDLMRAITDAVIIMENDRIMDCNDAAWKMVGARSRQEAMDKPIHFFHPEKQPDGRKSREKILKQIRKSLSGIAQKFYWKIRCLDGSELDTEMSLSRMTIDSKTFILAIMRDISPRLELENKLRQNQKMEAIGMLAGGIAHDFNNILSPILGFSELLLEDIDNTLPIYRFVQEIHTAGMRARQLTGQILSFSRQAETVSREPIRIQPILKEVLKMIRSVLPVTIDISQHIPEECSVIMADPVHIHQVLMNLVTNAFHAMEEQGGRLQVQLTELTFSKDDIPTATLSPGPYLKLSVIDTGMGIPEDILPKIFDPYFTTKEIGKGTGLGLSVVYGIVKKENGEIVVKSEAGKGSRFDVYWPCYQKEEDTAPDRDEGSSLPTGQEHLLLVDDEASLVAFIERMLKRLGYHVTTYTSSFDAMTAFQEHPQDFDLVLTDMTMPHMTGAQIARKVKAIRPEVPVLLMTGFSSKIKRDGKESFAIDDVLYKPILKPDLAKAIRRLLDRHAVE
jgi:PAS domain S-box-containing protein